jgi:hypothetical protein
LHIISKPNSKIKIDKIYNNLYNQYVDLLGNKTMTRDIDSEAKLFEYVADIAKDG